MPPQQYRTMHDRARPCHAAWEPCANWFKPKYAGRDNPSAPQPRRNTSRRVGRRRVMQTAPGRGVVELRRFEDTKDTGIRGAVQLSTMGDVCQAGTAMI